MGTYLGGPLKGVFFSLVTSFNKETDITLVDPYTVIR